MKILISRVGHEWDLKTELEARGAEVMLPIIRRRIRVSRKSNKVRYHDVLAVRRIVFSDIGDMSGLQWLQTAWSRDGEYVEVDRDEVLEFIECVASADEVSEEESAVNVADCAVGDVVVLPDGPFRGQTMRVVSIKGNKIKGMLVDGDKEIAPISLGG